MIRLVTQKAGSTLQVLVPFHALPARPALRGLRIENAPAVFIPVNRG